MHWQTRRLDLLTSALVLGRNGPARTLRYVISAQESEGLRKDPSIGSDSPFYRLLVEIASALDTGPP